jgi:hypothetical protein
MTQYISMIVESDKSSLHQEDIFEYKYFKLVSFAKIMVLKY